MKESTSAHGFKFAKAERKSKKSRVSANNASNDVLVDKRRRKRWSETLEPKPVKMKEEGRIFGGFYCQRQEQGK